MTAASLKPAGLPDRGRVEIRYNAVRSNKRTFEERSRSDDYSVGRIAVLPIQVDCQQPCLHIDWYYLEGIKLKKAIDIFVNRRANI